MWEMLKNHLSSTTSSWENVCRIKERVFMNEEQYYT